MQGTIKKVMSQRGYGFIDTDNQEDDLFFHKSNLDNIEFTNLREGTAVEFDIADGRRGPEAVNIKLSGESSSEEAPSEEEEE
ncbi:MAG: cold-shock protein [Candidatus Kariarchaeaceae archaeon]|jgi:CspA family cold shock protein